jgi:micrococcal nuclease
MWRIIGISPCLLSAIVTTSIASPRQCGLLPGPERTIARVLDAATLVLDDGMTVRLANLALPRNAQGADRLAADDVGRDVLQSIAAQATARLWLDQQSIDRHGFKRAQVTVRAGGQDRWLQVMLLEGGHARVDARHGERACVAPLLTAEAQARAAGAGVWSISAFRVRPAVPAFDLWAYRGTFQIVQGEVASVETARDLSRLVLGRDRRRALTISLRANDRELLGPLGGDLRSLVGKRIEARGYVETRIGGGPDVNVSLSGDVRLAP